MLIYTPTYACGCAAPPESQVSTYLPKVHYEQDASLWYMVCVHERLVVQLMLPFICERHDRVSIMDDGLTEKTFISEAILFNYAKIVDLAVFFVD